MLKRGVCASLCSLALADAATGRAQAPGPLERDLDSAKALVREGRLDAGAARLREIMARLGRLRELSRRRASLTAACLDLALSYVALGEALRAREAFEAALRFDPATELDARIYGAPALALFEEARFDSLSLPRAALESRHPGSVSVWSEAWVEVSLDGARPEQTPLYLPRVAAGRHTLRAGRPGFKTTTLAVDVPEGEALRIHLRLDPE